MTNHLTNQELLRELERKLPEFTKDELGKLFKLIMVNMPSHLREELLVTVKETNPQQTHDSIREIVRKAEQEKLAEQVKKTLNQK